MVANKLSRATEKQDAAWKSRKLIVLVVLVVLGFVSRFEDEDEDDDEDEKSPPLETRLFRVLGIGVFKFMLPGFW
jgi:hypothetical protein